MISFFLVPKGIKIEQRRDFVTCDDPIDTEGIELQLFSKNDCRVMLLPIYRALQLN